MLVKNLLVEHYLLDLSETYQTLRKHKIKLNPEKFAFRVSAKNFLRFMVSQRGIMANPKKVKAILDIHLLRNTKEVQRPTEKVIVLRRFISQATDMCYPFLLLLKKSFY